MGRFLPSTTTIYNIKRSTVDVHKIDIRVSASFLKKSPPRGSVRIRTPRRRSVRVRSMG